MQLKSLFLSAVAATGAIAQLNRECGTAAPTEEQLNISKKFQVKEDAIRLAGLEVEKRATIGPIKVYVHVLATSTAASGGYLTVYNRGSIWIK